MLPPIAEFRAVHKVYQRGLLRRRPIHALCDVSLTVPHGAVCGVIGPNRAGKTTLVKTLLSLCRPTSGRILRFGRPAECRGTLAEVGYVHECQAFPRYLTAVGLLRYYGRLSLVAAGDLDRRIAQLLDQVDLTDRAHEPIGTYSKGMLQRLALAQALVNDPALLVLDEPTEGMDLVARHRLHDIVRRHKAAGKTVMLVSHSLADVQRLCDQVAVLRAGRLVHEGAVADLLAGAAAPDSADALQDALEPMYVGASA